MPKLIIDKLLNKYKESSIKTMDGQIRRIHKLFNHDKYIHQILFNIHDIDSVLTSLKPSVKKAILNTVINIIKITDPDFNLKIHNNIFDKYCKIHEENYVMNNKHDDIVNIDHVVALKNKYKEYVDRIDFDNVKKDDWFTYIRYLALVLYSEMPPLRGEDYYNTYIIDSNNYDFNMLVNTLNYNFYDINTAKLVVKYHKTQTKYGTRIVDFNTIVNEVIQKWTLINNTKFLFPTYSKIKMSQQAFTDMITRIFKPDKVNIDILRHAYITEKSKSCNAQQLKDIAKIMGHSVTTQQMIYKVHQ